jgi:hypothetical protein
MMLSRNAGAGPYNWFPDSLRVRNQVRPPRLGMSPLNWFPLKSLKYEQNELVPSLHILCVKIHHHADISII